MKNGHVGTWIAAGVAAVLLAGTAAQAVEPVPDWVTLVFPTLVPKGGNTNVVPADLARNFIEYAYQNRYENYWKETSYYTHNPATGAKTQGHYGDTKTYGFIQVPWPLRPRPSRGTFEAGTGRPDAFVPGSDEGSTSNNVTNLVTGAIGAPNRRHSANAFASRFHAFPYDAADTDQVWSPGEAFNDADNDGQWDPAQPGEDFWDSSNTVFFNAPAFSYDPQNNNNEWSQYGGEMFVDYNGNYPIFNTGLTIRVAIGTDQVAIPNHSELDFSPSTNAASIGSNEGDFRHVIVTNTAVPMPFPIIPFPIPGAEADGVTIPRNGYFDATSAANGAMQVVLAGYIEYSAYCNTSAVALVRGYYLWNEVWGGTGSPPSTVELGTVRASVYVARELYGTYKSAVPAPGNGIRVYGDVFGALNAAANPTRRITNANDGQPTAAINGEVFEDFLSIYDPAQGGMTYVGIPAALAANASYERGNRLLDGDINTRGRTNSMTYEAYTNYLAWNYPGAWTSMVERCYNGRYDGPDDWTDQGSSGKWVWSTRDTPVAAAGEPIPAAVDPVTGGLDWPSMNPGGGWDPRSGFATWSNWYAAVFSGGATPAPAWPVGIQRTTRYTPNSARAANGWIPATSWSFDSPAEYCDLPSSIYHLNGNYANGSTLLGLGTNDPLVVFQNTNALYMVGGDHRLGEVTSPWNEEIWGHDIESGAAWYGTNGVISAAGPYCFNTIGGQGYDGANLMTMEFLTHRRGGVVGVDVHPPTLRDTNCDGYLDGGRELEGEASYSTGTGGIEDVTDPEKQVFSWHRYMEDVIALWDQSENFAQIYDRTSTSLPSVRRMYAYPIYPVAPGAEGWAALGGPSGQVRPFISRDTSNVLAVTFQVRPLNGGGEVPNIGPTGQYDPDWDPNSNPPSQDFGMALLSHEQGHDFFAWPDLYDYDVWSGGDPIINTPVAAYDLMSGGGLVHGLPDLKWEAGWIPVNDLTPTLPLDGGPVTVEFYPIERRADQYFTIFNPANPDEWMDLWYTDNNSDYGVVGGRGIYISHTDRSGFGAALPIQQKVNNHFTWEVIQGDGRTDLQDGINSGDTGDPFPGTRDMRVFSEDSQPAARWWDAAALGIRITNIELPPAGSDLPALVTFERYSSTTNWYTGRLGADTDADGISDAWEFKYFGDLVTASATSDFDLDGLSDFGEYLARLNPTLRDSDGNGMNDAQEDIDGDGINNLDEVATYGTDPGSADTDDDGLSDVYELSQVVFDPRSSMSPDIQRALRLYGTAGSYLQLAQPDTERRFQTGSLTVEMWASPTADILGTGVELYSRTWTNALSQSLVLGLTDTARPYLRYNTGSGVLAITNAAAVPLEPVGPNPMFVTNWTHLGASYELATRTLRLWVNGDSVGQAFNLTSSTLTNAAALVQRVGTGFRGLIDEVRVWNDIRAPSLIGMSGLETGLAGYYKFDDFTAATPGADLLWGTADDTAPIRGQVEDFVYPREWTAGWQHAASLFGNVTYYTNKFLQFPVLGLDSDLDGVADSFEGRHPGIMDPLAGDSHLDPDNDGWSSESEFLASVLADGVFTNTPSPADASSYPVPTIISTFKSSNPTNAAGQMVIHAYPTSTMDGAPDATIVIPAASVSANYPFTVQSTSFTSGHLKEGPAWFFAFKDFNNDGAWNVGEPFGLAENPVTATWNTVNLTFGLTVGKQGFGRFEWAAAAGVDGYRVYVRRTDGAQIIERFVTGRTYVQEGDYIAAGFADGLSENASYQWFVYRSDQTPFVSPPHAQGVFTVTYSSAGNVPAAPTPVTPDGAPWRYGLGQVAFRMDTNAVRYDIEVATNGGAVVFQSTSLVPALDLDGAMRADLALYTDGLYTWRVRGRTAHGFGAWSTARLLSVNLSPTPSGPYSISGEVFYQGKVLNPAVVVEARSARDFGGTAAARRIVQKISVTNEGVAGRVEFTLRGLLPGAYYLRAYLDQNGNGMVDPFESRGMMTSVSQFRAEAGSVPASLSGRMIVIRDRDTDSDRIPDAFEYFKVSNLTTMGLGSVRGWTDTDGDGLNDFEEYNESAVDSDPLAADTDGDGIPDGREVISYGTNPRVVDTDGDGLMDGLEITLGASPLKRDTNADGVSDGIKHARGLDFLRADTDGDGFSDLLEIAAGTDPKLASSIPACGQLFEIDGLDFESQGVRARFRLAPGIGRLAAHIEAWVEGACQAVGPWTEVDGTRSSALATQDADSLWSLSPGTSPVTSPSFYRLRWRLKE